MCVMCFIKVVSHGPALWNSGLSTVPDTSIRVSVQVLAAPLSLGEQEMVQVLEHLPTMC